MSDFDTWESYFYPETLDWSGNGTLRNHFGLRDADRLSDVEYAITARAARAWSTTDHGELGWGEERARAIHRHLFSRIYEWAGEYRTVQIGKGQSRYAHPDEIPAVLQAVEGFVESRDWPALSRQEFARDAAVTFAWVNAAHSFREGNGRTTKLFLDDVAKQSRWELHFEEVDPDHWNDVSERTTLRNDRHQPDPAPMVPVFEAITYPRTPTKPVPPTGLSPAVRASYPQSPATDRDTPPQRTNGPGQQYRGEDNGPCRGR